MTKYQYTYFIYPYVIDSKKYNKYMLKLLKNKNCSLRIFEREKDMHLYQFFLPKIKESMFWSFDLTKEGIKSFKGLDMTMKANLLSKHDCNIFQYKLNKDLQGKVGEKDGIFFGINEIKIICYKTGICFLVFKTTLQESQNFENVLNFNYKFREINSKTYKLKEYENIKIQSDTFKDIQEISGIIKEIVGNNDYAKKINLDNERFFVYSYACLDQSSWNENGESEAVKNEFIKYKNILLASKQIADSCKNNEEKELYENKYVRYGFSSMGTVLLTSDLNPSTYTTVPQKFESEYLYTYILTLYKKLLLQKIHYQFASGEDFKIVEKQFLDFTKQLWIQEITFDDFGKALIKKWEDMLEIEEMFMKLKREYDVLYKKYDVENSNKNNKVVLVVIGTVIVINIIGIIITLLK